MTTRRDFIRRGALWVAGAAVIEPVARKLWAFPTNPLGRVDEGVYRVVAYDTVPLLSTAKEDFLLFREKLFGVSIEALRLGGWHQLSAPRVLS